MIPITISGTHEIEAMDIAAVILPCAEVVLPAPEAADLAPGDYMIDDKLNSQCRSLMIVRALVDPSKGAFACKLLNPTDKPLKLRKGTPVGVLVSVTLVA